MTNLQNDFFKRMNEWKDLKIVQNARSGHMGVCIQRNDHIPKSATDAATLSHNKAGVGIIGCNEFRGIHVVHTSYLRLGVSNNKKKH